MKANLELPAVMLFSILMALASCEGSTTYSKKIQNNSSDTLFVKVYSASFGNGEFVSVKPGNKESVWISEKLGGSIDANYLCTQEFDSVVVDVSSGKMLTLDLMNIDSWVRESKDGRHAEENCTAEIFDTDLQ